MKKLVAGFIVTFALVMSCKTNTSSPNDKRIHLTFESKSGSKTTGTATFVERDGKVTLTAALAGMTPGVHAMHIHEKADCSAPDATSAGGHWNPTHENHGKWGSDSYHRGDIGNFTVDKSGSGAISMTTDQWCIGCGDPQKDILGKSLIVHEKADDYKTQPTGDAGGRMACSAIIR